MFISYSEAFGKIIGEYYYVMNLYANFWKYVARVGPPTFIGLWVADLLGIFDKLHYPNAFIEESWQQQNNNKFN